MYEYRFDVVVITYNVQSRMNIFFAAVSTHMPDIAYFSLHLTCYFRRFGPVLSSSDKCMHTCVRFRRIYKLELVY